MAPTLSKRQVAYRPASPLRLRERCGTCVMYRAGGSCTLVKGLIQPMAVCDRWAPKAGR